jgi:DNA-binding response OmpR family regulator
MKVLIIEDVDEVVGSIRLCISIRWPDCVTLTASRGDTGLRMMQTESPDLVILDVSLGDGQGLEALRGIRRFSDVPVLIVSTVADESSRVRGLELGADDYIAKPFTHAELLARIRATLRTHLAVREEGEGVVNGEKLRIDLGAGRVFVGGAEKELSATEWKLLSYLVRNAGKVISNRALTQDVWGLSFVENSTIKMCVRRVRLKLGDNTQAPRIIRSYRGRGYSFELPR